MAIKLLVSKKLLQAYRAKTYHTAPGLQIHSQKEAVEFVNKRGFVFFWPISNIYMPSLWCAAAGDRPVPNNHDDPGHITWRWKDDLIGKKKWYYAKVLRRKSTIVSLDMIPNFFALSPSVHDGLEEIAFHYRNGSLSAEEKLIYQLIFKNGPLDSITLREIMSSQISKNTSRLSRALDLLQQHFRIIPCGISQKGRWKYAYIYQTVFREFPELIEQSKNIAKEEAAMVILRSFFRSNGVGTIKDLLKLFGWEKETILDTLSDLISNQELVKAIPYWDTNEEIYTIPGLQ
jgi:hypothetical protein